MLALSIRQPWAWLILHAGKDIENRVWSTRLRGRILVHAAKGMTRDEYREALEFAHCHCGVPIAKLPKFEALERGGIVGAVDIADCVNQSESPWFVGTHGFVLQNPEVIPFHPVKGQLGFFNVPDINYHATKGHHESS